jgi:hypothetical protein
VRSASAPDYANINSENAPLFAKQGGAFGIVKFSAIYFWPGGLIVADRDIIRGMNKLERSQPETTFRDFAAERAARWAIWMGCQTTNL